jgi:RNA polymerase sigma-70 factor (ECF subfamily)
VLYQCCRDSEKGYRYEGAGFGTIETWSDDFAVELNWSFARLSYSGGEFQMYAENQFKVRNEYDQVAEADTGAAPRDAEEQLVESLRLAEDFAYETLVRSYGPHVMSVTARYLKCEAEAADCFQDTFVAVFQSIDSFEHRSSLRYWIRGIAINQCLMRLRKYRRRREESIDHMLPAFDEHGRRLDVAGPNEKSQITDKLNADHVRRVVRECIGRLPDDYRLVVLLRDIDGYSTREAALILGINANTVKVRLHRARSALKHMMEPLMEHEDSHVNL